MIIPEGFECILFQEFDDPSKHPVRRLARLASRKNELFQTRENLRKLLEKYFNENEAKRFLSIYDGVGKSIAARRISVFPERAKFKRIEWFEELDLD